MRAGRKAAALIPSEEALKINRELAGQNWAAYAPDLASCLGAHGRMQEASGRMPEAVMSFAEGIRTLTPHLQQLPSAYAMIMGTLTREYLRLADAAGIPPT